MNLKQKMETKNNSARLLEFTSRGHRNCLRVNVNNTFAHEHKKFEVYWMLKCLGYEVVTEAEFRGKNARADLFVLDDCVAIEIIESEKKDSIEKKRKIYPCRIVTVKTTEDFEEKMIK